MKFSAVIVTLLSVGAMAAPGPAAEEITKGLEKRGCPAGVICISSKCYYWYCGPFGCSTGGATGQGC
ncbi:hypothetical protein TWF694_005103 [Orbilia ellipsospora]|uniref:Uncharacterized protein n=1 Tax=Orbilia ellipsospora TaxID=2528407 RepID=A0AAV9WUR5_9PEZI